MRTKCNSLGRIWHMDKLREAWSDVFSSGCRVAQAHVAETICLVQQC